jgi:4-hydroxy-2-oxovalerate aldolase
MNTTESVTLVDVTVRDGGYANDYGFSTADVFAIASRLSTAGIPMIEIGHGYGLGADQTMGKMAHTDDEYISAVANKIPNAKIGMFANTKMATPTLIKRAAEMGLDFVRIGFIGLQGSPHPLDDALPLVESAKENGLWTSLNMVRSNYLEATEIDHVALMAEKYEADALYVVDSSGGTLPSQVAQMVKRVKAASSIAVGFHGHQNLDLGAANSLSAVEAGATFVDGTLGGIGRDAGNTQLEVLVAILAKAGRSSGVNPSELCAITEEVVAPLFSHPIGINRDCLELGRYDLFAHGLQIVRAVAQDMDLDVIDLLDAVAKSKPVFETEDVIREIAGRI